MFSILHTDYEWLQESRQQGKYINIIDNIHNSSLKSKFPTNPHALFSKGFALARLERYDEAMEYYEKAVQIDPTFTAARNNKGVALYNKARNRIIKGDLENGLNDLKKAVDINPDLREIIKQDRALRIKEKINDSKT
jgi:tetratricopeptide (TPR) repeat protein